MLEIRSGREMVVFWARKVDESGFGLVWGEREGVCFVCLGKPTPFCGPSLVRLPGGKRPFLKLSSQYYHVSNIIRI
jgi:hypothetical protein